MAEAQLRLIASSPIHQMQAAMDGLSGLLETPTGLIQAWTRLPELLAQSGLETAERRTGFRAHRLADLAMQDPLTECCWSHGPDPGLLLPLLLADSKGAGGAAQAQLRQASSIGRMIFSVTSHFPFAEGLRERSRFAAQLLDVVTEAAQAPAVLSLGAGSLPEAMLARRARDVARWMVVEKSLMALDSLLAAHGTLPGLEPSMADPLRTLLGPTPPQGFDLVLLGPLLDGLDEATAIRALRAAFGALRPGGRLFLGSFAEDLPDAAYLDAVMDWRPIRRSEDDLHRLAAALPAAEVTDPAVFRGPSRAMVFLQVTRRGG